MENLEKDVIVVADLSGIPAKQKVEKIGVYANLMTDNPTIVANISPTAAVLQTKVDLINAKFVKHKTMEEALMAFTKEINKDVKEASDVVVKEWVGQVSKACAGNILLIEKLGFGVKNTKVKLTTATRGRVTNSNPIISEVDSSVPNRHKIFVINSKTGKAGKPADALQTSVYGQIGGVTPNDVNKMITFGIIDRGVYIHDFDPADKGKVVFYIIAYISKKTKKAVAFSPVFMAYIG